MVRTVRFVMVSALVFSALALLGGCETTKNVVIGVADGLPKDIKMTSDYTWQALNKADTWVRERLW